MKHRALFIFAVWWVLLCAIAGIFLMATSHKDSRESLSENRMLQGFPSLELSNVLTGDAMEQFEDFLTDSFFGRDGVISFTNDLTGTFSTLSRDEIMINETQNMEDRLEQEVGGTDEEPAEETDIPEEDVPADEPDEALLQEAEEEEPELEVVSANGFLMTDTTAYTWMDNVDGTLTKVCVYPKENIDKYADILRLMRSYLPKDGKVFFTEVPLASVATRWVSQKHLYCGWGSSMETMLTNSLAGAEGIYVFNTYDILEPYVDGDVPMFYSTDHHWSAEGAYKVLTEMLKVQNVPIVPYDEYRYISIQSKAKTDDGKHDTFNALYPLYPVQSYIVTNRTKEKSIDLMNYDISTYRIYMNNTRLYWRRIVSGAGTGRKALVICDSFGNAFTPYLLAYYDEVHMCDFRKDSYSFKEVGGTIKDQIEYYGIDDVYIITSLANGLRKQNSLTYLPYYMTGKK